MDSKIKQSKKGKDKKNDIEYLLWKPGITKYQPKELLHTVPRKILRPTAPPPFFQRIQFNILIVKKLVFWWKNIIFRWNYIYNMDINTYIFLQEVLAWSAFSEKISLKNLQNPQKITFTRIVFFLESFRLQSYLKRDSVRVVLLWNLQNL